MPPLKSSLIKPSKSMLFFHIWNANFSVTPINSQMYMTKPKQVQKKLSENTGKTFSVIMPSFTCRGWAYWRKLLYMQSSLSKRWLKRRLEYWSSLVEAKTFATLQVEDELHGEALAQLLIRGGVLLKNLLELLLVCLPSNDQPGFHLVQVCHFGSPLGFQPPTPLQ